MKLLRTYGLCMAVLLSHGCVESVKQEMPLQAWGAVFVGDLPGCLWATNARIEERVAADPVLDAVVQIGGRLVPHRSDGSYVLDECLDLAPGDEVTMSVERGFTVSVTTVMPGKPVITAPAAGSTVDASTPVNVAWTPPVPAPDFFYVGVDGAHTATGEDWSRSVEGTETTFAIPAGTLRAVTDGIAVTVNAENTEATITDPQSTTAILTAAHVAVSEPFSTE
ncbi:MAG: hypothetical protein JRG91_17350 [Deltaproteobacteria bacterium]|nr:hypothetical protein [Deltaproteobacteria bacterium]